MKKTLLILLAGFFCSLLFSLLQSCDTCNSGPLNHILAAINGSAKRITTTQVSPGSNDTSNVYNNFSGDIRYDSLAIEVKNVFTAMNDAPGSFSWGFRSARACDPVENYSSLTNITVTSSAGYNTGLPAGTDLRTVLEIRNGYGKQGKSINDFLMSDQTIYGSTPFYFTFIAPPAADQTHDLVIRYFMQDGSQKKCAVKGVLIKK